VKLVWLCDGLTPSYMRCILTVSQCPIAAVTENSEINAMRQDENDFYWKNGTCLSSSFNLLNIIDVERRDSPLL
jgi:hypothetical protein